MCGSLLWIYHTKWSAPHECDALSSVLGALSAAGRVIVTKSGDTATLDCPSFKRTLEWLRESESIIVEGKYTRKGRNRLKTIPTAQYCCFIVNYINFFCIRQKWHCIKVDCEAEWSVDPQCEASRCWIVHLQGRWAR